MERKYDGQKSNETRKTTKLIATNQPISNQGQIRNGSLYIIMTNVKSNCFTVS
jgi:hypothetical protein